MNTSIEKLVVNLSDGCKLIQQLRETFKNTSEHFKDDEQFEMMTKKGIYPYDYIDNFNKMSDDKLPSIENFIVIYIIARAMKMIIKRLKMYGKPLIVKHF